LCGEPTVSSVEAATALERRGESAANYSCSEMQQSVHIARIFVITERTTVVSHKMQASKRLGGQVADLLRRRAQRA